MQRLNTANFYSGTRKNGITATERRLIQFAKDDLDAALKKTNSFFSDTWKGYRESIEAVDLSPFKETKTFTID